MKPNDRISADINAVMMDKLTPMSDSEARRQQRSREKAKASLSPNPDGSERLLMRRFDVLSVEELRTILPGLVKWVEWLIESHEITSIRPCWLMHGRVVEELHALRLSYIALHGTKDASGPMAFHNNYYQQCLDRISLMLKECSKDECRRISATGPRTRIDPQLWSLWTDSTVVTLDRYMHWPMLMNKPAPRDEVDPIFVLQPQPEPAQASATQISNLSGDHNE